MSDLKKEYIKNYKELNSKTIDKWVSEGWEWGIPITSEEFNNAKKGIWGVKLTPTKIVPHEWFGDLRDKKILGLASGGGQQMPIFKALGAICTVLDYSKSQLESEKMVAERENYDIEIIHADMAKPLPFDDEIFDIIFQPVSNNYIEKVEPLFKESYRILKKGGILLSGLDNGFNYTVDEKEEKIINSLLFNPLKNKSDMEICIKEDCGIQFSHSLEEQIGGQLKAGFVLTDILEDSNGIGRLHELNIPSYILTRAVKK